MYKDTQYSGTNNVKLFTCLWEESINTKKREREREEKNPLLQMIQTQVTLFLATGTMHSTRVMNCEMAALKGHLRCFHVQRRGDQKHTKSRIKQRAVK